MWGGGGYAGEWNDVQELRGKEGGCRFGGGVGVKWA